MVRQNCFYKEVYLFLKLIIKKIINEIILILEYIKRKVKKLNKGFNYLQKYFMYIKSKVLI